VWPADGEVAVEKLEQDAVTHALSDLEDWELEGDAITKTFRFHDFVGSVDFVNAVAEAAEGMQHHPDIDIRYNKVTLTLSTHEAGGLTRSDFELAKEADHRGH
jgi:4a-hydroxytetrahydrobiopterin dehydratase